MAEYSTKHYQFQCTIPVTQKDLDKGYVEFRLDPYFVSKEWKLGSKDQSGALFHQLKTISRFGDKNPIEREINALFNQAIGMARTHNVKLEVHDWNQIQSKANWNEETKPLKDLISNYEKSMNEIKHLINLYHSNPNLQKFNHLLDKILAKLPE